MNHRPMAAKVVGSGGGLGNAVSHRPTSHCNQREPIKKASIDSEMKLLFNNVFM